MENREEMIKSFYKLIEDENYVNPTGKFVKFSLMMLFLDIEV
jgi:hypothetical protein